VPMKKMQNKKQNVLFFRKWKCKGFAVFASLGKQIFIAVLSVCYSLISLQSFSQSGNNVNSSISVDTLPEVEVLPDEEALLALPSQIIELNLNHSGIEMSDRSEQAEWLPGFDVRSRGEYGVQGDIQFRGGSPEQVVVLLNGIPLNDMQTGHNTLNLPVPDICINRIIGYSGAESLFMMHGAYSGAVNYSCSGPSSNFIRMHIAGGSFSILGFEAMAGLKTGKFNHIIAFSEKQSQGYTFNTDFHTEKAYYMLNCNFPKAGYFRMQAGFANKKFGAQSFYSNRFPYQFEVIKTGFISFQAFTGRKTGIHPSVFWKRTHDRFELFRESIYSFNDGFYVSGNDTAKYTTNSYESNAYYTGHNYHLSDRTGFSLNADREFSPGFLKLNISYNYDRILSTVLGDLLNKNYNDPFEENIELGYGKNRNMATAYAGFSSKSFHGIRFQFGIMGFWYESAIKPGGGFKLSYSAPKSFTAWLSFTLNQRIPTFTELYYKSLTHTGNSNLKPEDAYSFEAGVAISKKWFSAENRLFLIDGLNTIDWVRAPNENIYHSMNHTHITTFGNTMLLILKPSELTPRLKWFQMLNFSHTYLNKTKYSSELLSAYTLDYLVHKLNANTVFNIMNTLNVELRFLYQVRNGTYTLNNSELKYSPNCSTDAGLSYKSGKLTMYIFVNNIFNSIVPEFGGIVPPGRWFSAGIKINTGK